MVVPLLIKIVLSLMVCHDTYVIGIRVECQIRIG
jgi:hypothetical protein